MLQICHKHQFNKDDITLHISSIKNHKTFIIFPFMNFQYLANSDDEVQASSCLRKVNASMFTWFTLPRHHHHHHHSRRRSDYIYGLTSSGLFSLIESYPKHSSLLKNLSKFFGKQRQHVLLNLQPVTCFLVKLNETRPYFLTLVNLRYVRTDMWSDY